MKTYGQYCPVAKAAEILGDRWTLLIVRDLLFGPVGFNELARGMPGISRSASCCSSTSWVLDCCMSAFSAAVTPTAWSCC